MLSTNVLCIKKRKKRSYCIASPSEYVTADKNKRSAGGVVNMLQITEDTPPDMLAGAMDLTVHLPTGGTVKMSVERSTPMMDLLVQVTTNQHLQLSGYTLQALSMAPSHGHADRILPFKPNTPIGALDTQHIKVIPKSRTIPVPKNIPTGHQPFESTFRLKVHLPRNQLFVTRVSQSVHLEEIMKKVCQEKNLEPVKYEFRHPGNLDEILDPKLSLSDYQITEIYLVTKGTGSLNQAFSSSDIMALRKEEERKQMHNKTGGGVFNLIFRRGNKSSSGSLSSDNRSISPTQSDDSRSVTPPAVPQQIITPPQPDPPVDKPKPPQRKRRPAPKPPQRKDCTDKPPSNISDLQPEGIETGLTLCHSRNSSDSSGYHEASVLSENCNTSLPRRPKSTIIPDNANKLSEMHSQSTSNLTKMSTHSKSTSSLAVPGRKKKSAPPPPPALASASSVTNLQTPSPVVASQPSIIAQPSVDGNGTENLIASRTNHVPVPRVRSKIAPTPRPRSLVALAESEEAKSVIDNSSKEPSEKNEESKLDEDKKHREAKSEVKEYSAKKNEEQETLIEAVNQEEETEIEETVNLVVVENIQENVSKGPVEEVVNPVLVHQEESQTEDFEESFKRKQAELAQLQRQIVSDIFKTENFVAKEVSEMEPEISHPKNGEEDEDKVKPPEVVAMYPKPAKKDQYPKSMFDSYTRKRGFQIGTSLLKQGSDDESITSIDSTSTKNTSSDLPTPSSVASALNSFNFVDEIQDVDEEIFKEGNCKDPREKSVLNQLHGMHELENLPKSDSINSLRSLNSLPGFLGNNNMKKWQNVEELDDISLHSMGGRKGWVIGDTSDSDSLLSTRTPLDSLASIQSTPTVEEVKPVDIPSPQIETEKVPIRAPEIKAEETDELDSDWQYQLPSPPKAFRDSSPVTFTETTNKDEIADSVVTSPELFEKLKVIKKESETVSEVTSVVSEEEKPIFSKLSLENLEKRKSLVYNRELSTSLKASEEETFSSSLTKFEKTYEEVRRSSPVKEVVMTRSTLPNFKITTYDNPKQKLNIFEDDTIRSNTTDGRRDSAESNLRRTSIGRSMDNISFGRKGSTGNTSDDDFKKPDYKFYKPQSKTQINVFRSESFSKEQEWSPSKPVTRSKSQVALNRYKTNASNVEEEDNLNKTGSLFDVSGLQSLGVMRLIQTKLNTPTNSMDNLNTLGKPTQEPEVQRPEPQPEHRPEPRKAYRVPSINMGTWSERPKIPVNVKEDPDYKFGVKDNNSSKLIVNTTNNNMKSYNSIEVKKLGNNFSSFKAPESKNVSIKVNGSESISTQTGGNVVIKIGESKPVTFRKPLGNINKIGNGNPRPHSIAFGSDFDISRVPVVRSVEFKKPYKDYQNNNTTVTHIYPSNNFKSHTLNKTTSFNNPQPLGNGTEKYQSSESLLKPQPEPKPVFRVNSYLPKSSTPVVRGFQANRMSWNQPQSISTLPSKNDNKVFSTNKSVPFSQTNLKRAESAKVPVTPPPPPVLPKLNHVNTIQPVESNNSDPKEQLLQAIRDFGGKRGLRGVRA